MNSAAVIVRDKPWFIAQSFWSTLLGIPSWVFVAAFPVDTPGLPVDKNGPNRWVAGFGFTSSVLVAKVTMWKAHVGHMSTCTIWYDRIRGTITHTKYTIIYIHVYTDTERERERTLRSNAK